jgi:pimeloyl-ACP methyl ester carboxylesterase
MAKTSSHQHNPALKHLEVVVGDWEMKLSNASFLLSPSDTAKGHVSFKWVQDGAFLVMRMGDKSPGPPNAMWLITVDIDCVLIYELMAVDIGALISYLGLEHYDLFCYSLGSVALQNAIRHPHVVRRLVVVSSSYKSDGWYPEVLAGMASRNTK